MFYGSSYQSSPRRQYAAKSCHPGRSVDFFNSVTDPTTAALVGVVWDSTLSNRTLLETRFGFNRFWNPIVVNNTIDPKSLGINTGPLEAADLGVPGVTTATFGHIGGVGGYPDLRDAEHRLPAVRSLTHTHAAGTPFKMGGSWDSHTTRAFAIRRGRR